MAHLLKTGASAMPDGMIHLALLDTIDRYFETMFDNDAGRFDQVFAPTAQLHGLRDGALRVLAAADYRTLMLETASPKSKSAPRHQEILSIDFASDTQACAKVSVRIEPVLYLDYLLLHRVSGGWIVTAKSFHVARRFDTAAA
jgi:Putative lumazine-binding